MIDEKTRNELIEIKSMAELVIERVDRLIPDQQPVQRKRRSRLSAKAKSEILNRRKLIRFGHG